VEFPKGTKFKEGTDERSGKKVKIAVLPDGTELKFFTEENLEDL